LTTIDLTLLGIGGIVGAGVYVLTGQAAALYAGPAVVLSFVISGIGCAFSALCYSELASMLPMAGSAYTFASATLGQFVGFLIGWDLTLEYLMGAATVAVGWSAYAQSGLRDMGATLPREIAVAPWAYDPVADVWSVTGGMVNLPAVLVITLMTCLNVLGIQESVFANNVIVVVKCVVLVMFVCAGCVYIQPSNWQPFVPPEESLGHFGWSGIFRGSAVVYFSYIGFDSISNAAQEAVDPQRSLPIATLASLFIATALYIAVALVLTGLVSYRALNVSDPIAVAVDAAGGALNWLRPVVKLGAVLGLSSVVLVMLMGQARVTYAMASDGMLPACLARVHRRYKTPWLTSLLTGLIAALVAGLVPMEVLGEMVSIGTLFAFTVVCAGVMVLRRRQPLLYRPFRTPWVPAVPLAGMAVAVLQVRWRGSGGGCAWEWGGAWSGHLLRCLCVRLCTCGCPRARSRLPCRLRVWLPNSRRLITRPHALALHLHVPPTAHSPASQMVSLPAGTWVRFTVWLVIGLAVYYFYSRGHARSTGQRARILARMRGAASADASAGGDAMADVGPVGVGKLSAARAGGAAGGISEGDSLTQNRDSSRTLGTSPSYGATDRSPLAPTGVSSAAWAESPLVAAAEGVVEWGGVAGSSKGGAAARQ